MGWGPAGVKWNTPCAKALAVDPFPLKAPIGEAMADSLPLSFYSPSEPVATEYRVGLCSWQDKSMIEEGYFYPVKMMKAAERLWWYSRYFDTVEVNSTFYAPLSEQNALLWAQRTPRGFLFNIKAYGLLTGHHLDAERLPEPLREFLPAGARPNARGQFENKLFPEGAREWAFRAFQQALTPLTDQGKLGYVLFQLAPWVNYGPETLAYVASFPDRLPGVTIGVEFRNSTWLPTHTNETLSLLARRKLSYVAVDAPHHPANVATTLAITHPEVIYRLHGRNVEGHLKQLRGEVPTVAEKYGYLYTEEEVKEIIRRLEELSGHASRVYVMYNNNRADYPAINGLQTKEKLVGWTRPSRALIEAEWRTLWKHRRPKTTKENDR